MKRVVVLTEGRMSFDLLYWPIKKLGENNSFEIHVVATGSHLSKHHGYTIQEIEKAGIKNVHKIKILPDKDHFSKRDLAVSMSILTKELADLFTKISPDLMIFLGDRYELLAAAGVATVMNVPIVHISGGDVSEGAIDEQIRHALTKLSHLHFPGSTPSYKNLIRLGEDPARVFNCGDPCIENIKKIPVLSKLELFDQLKIANNSKPIFLITYHPTTLEVEKIKEQVNFFISGLKSFDSIQIITSPNQDFGGSLISQKLREYAKNKPDVYFFHNLGHERYLNLMRLCDVVIGNSSSGIIETPAFRKPTINVGNRQKGRLRCKNIIDCSEEEIVPAINKALSDEFLEEIKDVKSPYGNGDFSNYLSQELEKIEDFQSLLKKKLCWGEQ